MASDKCMVLMLEHAVKLTDINPSMPGIQAKRVMFLMVDRWETIPAEELFRKGALYNRKGGDNRHQINPTTYLLTTNQVIFPCCTACVLSVSSASPSDMGNEGFGLFCMLRLIFISIGYKQCGTPFAFMFPIIHRKASG
ncbi:hypothetical protein EI94DRAFT_1699438 [Lactarius quietus]|nr:hypothetical protein EI94DRAFT_1699438 [Lactarius quietus]